MKLKYKNYSLKLFKLFIRLSLSNTGNLIFYIYYNNKGLSIYSLSDVNLFDIEISL